MKKWFSAFTAACLITGLVPYAARAQEPALVTVDAITAESDHPALPSALRYIDGTETGARWTSNQSFKYNNSSCTGIYFEFTFCGTSVELIGYKDRNTGNIDVSLDGALDSKAVIGPSANGAAQPNQTLYKITGLEPKEHTLKVTVREDYPAKYNYFELQKIRYEAVKSDKDQLTELVAGIGWDDVRGENTSSQEVWTDLNLSLELPEGVQVVWSTEPGGYIDDATGEIIKQDENQNQNIRLTGTFTKNSETVQKSIYFTLLKNQGITLSPDAGFYDGSGQRIVVINPPSEFWFKTQLDNQTQETQELKLLAGVYSQNKTLLRCQTESVTLLKGEKKPAQLRLNADRDECVKVFCWTKDSMKPLHRAFMIGSGSGGIYVSPAGNDSNDGSAENPFRTVNRATLAAKAMVAADPNRRVDVLIRGGEYRLEQPVAWSASESPSAAGRVTYRAYENEEPVFSGAAELGRLNWSQYSGGIMVSQVGTDYDFDVLYVNGERQIMARYPNYTTPDTLFGYDGDAADVLSAARVKAKWKTAPPNGYVRALHDSKWGGNSFKITKVDSAGKVTLKWVGDNNRGQGYDSKQMIVENVFEELDAPGEWYYDKAQGRLYFYPPTGMDLSTALVEGASAAELVRLTGSGPENPVRNIAFEGIHFTKTHRTLFTKPYERPLRGDWGIARTGTVYIENGKDISVSDCRFTETGGNAVMMSGYNEGHVIDRSRMTQIGASAVLIVGKEASVRDPSHWDNKDHKTTISDTTAGPKSEDYAREITVSNNYMYDLGLYEKQVSGVCMSIASRIHVKGNTIHRCPRAGINISDGTFGGHLIEDNDVFDCVRGTSDHGPINSWGRDRFWSLGGYNTTGSKGDQKAPYAFLDAMDTTVIRHNRISHHGGAYGLDLDDGSSNYEIYDNLFLGTGVKLREGFSRTVRNNIIINSCVNMHVSYVGNNDKVSNNIIINLQPYRFIAANEGSKTTFTKNLLYYGGQALDVRTSGLSADTDHCEGNPLFTDPKTHDYTVKAGSPALAAGFCNFDMSGFGVPGAPTPPPEELNFTAGDDGSDEEDFLGGRISSVYSEDIMSTAGLPDRSGLYIIAPPAVNYTGTETLNKTDVIRTMNGAAVQNKSDFLAKYQALAEGETVSVTIFRNQEEYAKPVVWIK